LFCAQRDAEAAAAMTNNNVFFICLFLFVRLFCVTPGRFSGFES
jgi:hypothetical protein